MNMFSDDQIWITSAPNAVTIHNVGCEQSECGVLSLSVFV